MNYQYIYQHNQSTVETATAISNMFVKQKSEIKHIHTMVVVVVKICVCFLGVSWPRQHIKGHIELVSELLALFLDRRRPPKTKGTCILVHPPVTDNCPSWVSGREINLMISLYVSYVAGHWLELMTPVFAVWCGGDCVITSCLCNDNEWL